MLTSLLPLVLGALVNTAPAADAETPGDAGLLTRTVAVGRNSYKYQLYVPAKLRGRKDAPVIVFLHGVGQRGAGGFVPADGAAGALARRYLEQLSAIALLPQGDR